MPGYKDLRDVELVALLKAGEERAFTEAYDRYSMMHYYRVNQMLRDSEASKDIVQEIFMALWDKPQNIQENANLAGYLYVAGRNKVLKLIEKGRVRNDYIASIARFASEVSTATLDEIDEQAIAAIIEKEIQNLPSKMREVFELSRKANLSHKEIAEHLNISDKTVKKQINNVIKILKPKLTAVAPAGAVLLELLKKH
jgi:RNA polymerase sigma-70 factor (family 1)